MSFLSFGEDDSGNPVVALTDGGTRKAERPGKAGMLSRTLYILYDQGPTSVKDLSKRLKVSKKRTQGIVQSLLDNKDIRVVQS